MEATVFTTTVSKPKQKICRDDEGAVLIPGTIFGRAFRQRLTGATFSNTNSISPKNDVVSKQFPCMRVIHRLILKN
jgi:hypothetical protein